MTKYILTVWSSFTPQCLPSQTGQAILVRKVNIHAYSMYVLLADKVFCPMTQHFDPGDSQISNSTNWATVLLKSIIFVNMTSSWEGSLF